MEPTSFIAGETVEWKCYLGVYPPIEGWSLSYSFRNFQGGFDIAAISKDDHYFVLIPADKTASYKDGGYFWQATVTKDDLWRVIKEGSIEIKPNLALLDNYDGRTHVKKVLDALDSMILGKASRDQLSYSISGRSLS